MALLSENRIKFFLLMAFWLMVFMINLGYDWHRFESFREVIEVGGLKTFSQWMVAFIAINFMVPKFLQHEKLLAFTLSLIILAFIAAEFYIAVSVLYLEPAYPSSYGAFYINNLNDYTLIERLGLSDMIRYIIISKIPTLLFPAVILIAVNFYEKQKRLLEYKEKKQAAELNALKTQLNPHFIFNTLNNIYSMAINRSPNTAEAVAKLSGIFDYVLYQCNEKFVSLNAEVEMIENYIALEELRYGDRAKVTFSNHINGATKVAPLLYLSLVENAFKHGVREELTQAHIDISFNSEGGDIVFKINNSKPESTYNIQSQNSIGINNLKKQLNLIYPNRHQLQINENQSNYSVVLKLQNPIDSQEHNHDR